MSAAEVATALLLNVDIRSELQIEYFTGIIEPHAIDIVIHERLFVSFLMLSYLKLAS